ncbi:MAG TPA: ATP-binding cassette domain-containing protein [Leucothrix mucor]|uniref:ATP-binding cassette domain-containing protein n=1 Tax=Leucothrix mucor TaxID=45248 RepID=A0A7V2T2P0_LEUMU|nr:ATP-binding cassette domain-containing protein [Leucothrix mucor]
MLKQLKIENFTVFPKADLKFASGLNVIVGENGCGKSHLLKLLYAISFENTLQGKKLNAQKPSKEMLELIYAEKLRNVFHINHLEELVRYEKSPQIDIIVEADDDGEALAAYPVFQLNIRYSENQFNTSFSSDLFRKSMNVSIKRTPKKWDNIMPVFMPTRELLTIYPGFISLYERYHIEFDETYRDTCILLGSPTVKGKREKQAKEMLKPLERAMGGKVIFENERFYLSTTNKGKLEMPMVAEGQRKLAMLARLIATGTLLDNGYLFWDEPESNLNSKLIKLIAKVILHLCNNGIQVFIATHSLFLLRELAILSHDNKFNSIKSRYFALRLEENHSVQVEQGNSIEELQTLVLLDEELSQSDRFMRSGA